MSERPIARFASAIQELARAHAAASPPPRGLPYLGLEHASGTGFHLLDALADRGIFRKYELVLDLGAALGGSSRWLAGRLGCEVVGTTADVFEAWAGRELTRRARLAARVRLLPADPRALPFRATHFTHVWALETLPRLADPVGVLHEAFRVVRRGGTIALQDLVSADGGAAPTVPGWCFATRAARVAALGAAGFVDVEVRDRTDEAGERSAQVTAARARLLGRLREDATLASRAVERDALAAALATGALRVVQLLARRP